MHILMVTNNYSPYSGGVVSSINATVAGLQQQGHQVTLVTLDFLGSAHQDPVWVIRLRCPFKCTYKKNHMAVAWRAEKQLNRIITQLQPDLVHVHHPFLLGRIAARIAKAQGIATVFTYHTIYEAYAHYLVLPEWLTKPFIKRRVLSFCSDVTGIIAPSLAIKTYLEAENIATPICVVPSAVQERFFAYEPSVRLRTKEQRFRLLTVGRMVKEKNIESLLHAAHMLKAQCVSYTLTLVGYGAEYEALQAYAFDVLKLSREQIIFVHQPTKETILQLYRESDVFLFSSHTDTQGLVLAEAMACGLPVVALDGPGQRDIIMQGQNGYIVSTEHDMVARIAELYADAALLQRLSDRALITVQRYHPDVFIATLLDVYRQCKQAV